MRNGKQNLARLVMIDLIINIITLAPTLFIVLGHDAGAPNECTPGNGLCTNFGRMALGSHATTSPTVVSTGDGLKMTMTGKGSITAWAQILAFQTGGNVNAQFALYFSTIAIPSLGTTPPVADRSLQTQTSQMFLTGTANFSISCLGSRIGITTTFFVYLVFSGDTSGHTVNTGGGDLVVLET